MQTSVHAEIEAIKLAQAWLTRDQIIMWLREQGHHVAANAATRQFGFRDAPPATDEGEARQD